MTQPAVMGAALDFGVRSLGLKMPPFLCSFALTDSQLGFAPGAIVRQNVVTRCRDRFSPTLEAGTQDLAWAGWPCPAAGDSAAGFSQMMVGPNRL
jgi:hypothetical protein